MDDDWQRRNLPIRMKNILRRLKEHTVPHAVLSGHTAYSSPRQNASSLEAQRLIDYTKGQRKAWCCGLVLALLFVILAIGLGSLGVFLMITACKNYSLAELPDFPVLMLVIVYVLAVFVKLLPLGLLIVAVKGGKMRAKLGSCSHRFLFIVYIVLCLFFTFLNIFIICCFFSIRSASATLCPLFLGDN